MVSKQMIRMEKPKWFVTQQNWRKSTHDRVDTKKNDKHFNEKIFTNEEKSFKIAYDTISLHVCNERRKLVKCF